MAFLLGPGCRAEHERLEDKGAAIFSTTFLVRPSQWVPFVRCASDGLNNRFEVRASLGPSFFFPMFVELVLLGRILFSRTQIGKLLRKHEPNGNKTIALHRHVALILVINGP